MCEHDVQCQRGVCRLRGDSWTDETYTLGVCVCVLIQTAWAAHRPLQGFSLDEDLNDAADPCRPAASPTRAWERASWRLPLLWYSYCAQGKCSPGQHVAHHARPPWRYSWRCATVSRAPRPPASDHAHCPYRLPLFWRCVTVPGRLVQAQTLSLTSRCATRQTFAD